ncbi:hypothetical protein [Arthrobacter sp. GMC3]|uniref:hypothetical protein n=1 Tax=Arthrobacter sp. GMC3 TaxID=2058894 RepID=UPI000CE3D61D|nr:hypothetical protein [Arthrobacter sp. GMC3]
MTEIPEVLAEAYVRRGAKYEELNAWYVRISADLVPEQRWPDGSLVTPHSIYAKYRAGCQDIDQRCDYMVGHFRESFQLANPQAVLPEYLKPGFQLLAPLPPPVTVGPPHYPSPSFNMTKDFTAKPRKPWRGWVIAALACVLAVLLISSMGNSNRKSEELKANAEAAATHTVLYEVEGTAKGADLTLETLNGTSQLSGKAVPLANKTSGKRGMTLEMPAGSFVYISAQNTGSSGTISCKITVDGVVVAHNSSSGGYTIATCTGKAR